MPSEIEMQKRANYHDLGRDDFMALEEYLLSGLSDRDLEKKAGGGMMNINDMTRPVGYENGGNVITRRLASIRAEKPFEDFLKDLSNPETGEKFTKIDDKTGRLRGAKGKWNAYLNSKNIKVGSVEATDELNRMLKAAGKPRYVDVKMAGKGTTEDLISAITDTKPGESGAREARNKVNAKIKDLKTQGNKLHGANPSKAKNAFFKETLERMWPILKNTTKGAAVLSATLAKTALGKALGPLDLLITTEMGSGELTPEMVEEFKKGQAQERMNKRGGGMMDIYDMTKPLGYKEGNKSGEVVGDREKKVGWAEPYSTEALDNLMRKLGRKIKDFAKYGWGDKEDYMEIGGRQVDPDDPNFRRFIENNYQASGESYIEGIENYRKAVEGEGFQRGGLASINQMTRPVHMAGGGEIDYSKMSTPKLEKLLLSLPLMGIGSNDWDDLSAKAKAIRIELDSRKEE